MIQNLSYFMPTGHYPRRIISIVEFLRTARQSASAVDLADKLECSVDAVYKRLRRLRERGIIVVFYGQVEE